MGGGRGLLTPFPPPPHLRGIMPSKLSLSYDPQWGCFTSTEIFNPLCMEFLPIELEDADICDKVNHLLDKAFDLEVSIDPEIQQKGRSLRTATRHAWRNALKAEAAELSCSGRYPVRWRDLRVDTGPGGYAVKTSIRDILNCVMLRYDIAGPRRISGAW